MGTTESTMAGGGGGGKGVNKGPFTDAEYALVVQVFNAHRDGATGRIPKAGMAALFAVPTAPGFGEGLFRAFKAMPVFDEEGNVINQDPKRTDRDSLCFAEFFNGVSACSRASDRSILQVVYKALDAEGKGQLPYAQVKELLRVAYQCLLLSRCPPSCSHPPPSQAQAQATSKATSAAAAPAASTPTATPTAAPTPEMLRFDSSMFTHPIIREHDLNGAGLSSSASSLAGQMAACALMTTGSSTAATPSSAPSSASHGSAQHAHGFLKGDEEEEPVPFDEFYPWVAETFPLLYQCFGAFVYSRVCPGMGVPQQLRLQLPRLLSPSTIMTKQEELFALALSSGSLQSSWNRLYSSDENGMSFNRVCHHILGYRGPTAIVIRDTQGFVFGFYTAEAWKESNGYYGSSECFLFRLEPSFIEARPKAGGGAKHYMYLNLKGFSLPHGLGVGGSIDTGFRLFLPESLEGCVAASADGTFGYGPLAGSKHFDLESLEVWGVGGDDKIKEATAAQGKARELTAENIAKARKVDKSKFLDSDFDKEMFLAKTFGLEGAAARDRGGRD